MMKYYKYTLIVRYDKDTFVNESKNIIKDALSKLPEGVKFTLTKEKID